MSQQRLSGLLLHPTSLSGPGGIGSFGATARQFIDFLQASGQSLWQVLPLGPTGYGNSPYSCYSAFAGNPLLIDLDEIVEEGNLDRQELSEELPLNCVDFAVVGDYKLSLLRTAAERFLAGNDLESKNEFWGFCDSAFWLHDYALFMACKQHFRGKSWNRWPFELGRRSKEACSLYSEKLGRAIGIEKYIQWQFYRQWIRLKKYANSHAIKIIGDAPIFVAYDSADVWCNQNLFSLDSSGKPDVVAGVPPDYFSKNGQRWGNPLYKWDRHAEQDYSWWSARIRHDLILYDILRIDHFRGFEAHWEIPAREKTAINGKWVKGPGAALFKALEQTLAQLPLIAEDLGVITPEVEALRDNLGFPGMTILQFSFDSGPANPYLPHNHSINSVVYTGTHDNNTTRGWFESLTKGQQLRVCSYLRCKPEEVVWEMIRAAFSSVARYSIIPVQDLMNLDVMARMNMPGVASGNWSWRIQNRTFDEQLVGKLRDMTELYNRLSA
jgi:4-alpha-glucanotransferase